MNKPNNLIHFIQEDLETDDSQFATAVATSALKYAVQAANPAEKELLKSYIRQKQTDQLLALVEEIILREGMNI